ncbi:MAG: ABC transporter permease [Myxococcota bacterium]
MSAPLGRAVRVLAPNDLRLVWRDGFLLLLVLALPVYGLALRWLAPYLTGVVAEWFDLERYYGLVLAFFLIGQQPILLGAVIGILFVEERDEGTLLALQASPLSLRSFLLYRMLAAMGLSVVLTSAGVWLAGLVAVSPLELLASSAVASLSVPLVALVYAVYMQNKVQAVTAIKAGQIWSMLPALLYFVPAPWSWIVSLLAPIYYPVRLFWSAAEGQAEWWLVVPGLCLQGAAVAWLLRRFRRVVFG